MRLTENVAIVTGGSRGIGLGVARRLASEGAAVAVADIDADRARAAASTLQQEGLNAIGLPVNVADEASVDQLFSEVATRLGLASILVHAAAVWSNTPIGAMSIEEWQRIQDINVRGTFLVGKRAMRDMVPAGYGRIINIASTIFLSGGACFSHYAASKGAVIAFTRALAGEAGPHSITVNAIAPGLIATEAALETHGAAGVQAVVAHQLIHRSGLPDDIAEAAAYFASPGAGFTTGQTLYVNGGTHFG